MEVIGNRSVNAIETKGFFNRLKLKIKVLLEPSS